MPNKFRVNLGKPWSEVWPPYFENFYKTCQTIAHANDWQAITVCNHKLSPHGKLIQTSTQGWYLRWDDAKYHTDFVLRWS